MSKAKALPGRFSSLVLGTSRTEHLRPGNIGATIHSYRGATLQQLSQVIDQYPRRRLKTVTIIAGFNDHREQARTFVSDWSVLLQKIIQKFNPLQIIASKTVCTSKNILINQKVALLNHALYQFLNTCQYPIPIFPPTLISTSHSIVSAVTAFSFLFMEIMFLLKYFVSMLASLVVFINDS